MKTSGPAEERVTSWIEARANELLADKGKAFARVPAERARRASSTHLYGFLDAYVGDLESALDLGLIRDSGLTLGVDPLSLPATEALHLQISPADPAPLEYLDSLGDDPGETCTLAHAGAPS